VRRWGGGGEEAEVGLKNDAHERDVGGGVAADVLLPKVN
jgi:hypothetical protein